MLDNVKNEINKRISIEESEQNFKETISSMDLILEDFVELMKGAKKNMRRRNDDFLFEDTEVDLDVGTGTRLTNELELDDDAEFDNAPDLEDGETELQGEEEFDDNYTASVISDFEVDSDLDDEVEFSDTQKSPVNVEPYSNEAADLLSLLDECGDADCADAVLASAKYGEEDGYDMELDDIETVGDDMTDKVDDTENPEGGNYTANEAADLLALLDEAADDDFEEDIECGNSDLVDECDDMIEEEEEDLFDTNESDMLGLYEDGDVDVDVAVDNDDDEDDDVDLDDDDDLDSSDTDDSEDEDDDSDDVEDVEEDFSDLFN